MENTNSKKVWTDEERLKLAAQLDTELDDYMNQLEKKVYTEGWSADHWQEEMEKHPFFMKEAPKPGEELSPLMEGLQQLKFGEDYNTPEELALNYKEDGNFNYKHKKYRMAIISYTEGIKTKCKDQELIAQLYNNRAASHYVLQNYRSSLNDCKQALNLKPDYGKCLERAADCCFHIRDYDRCLEFCEQAFIFSLNKKHICDLIKRAITSKKHLQRNKRKQEKEDKNLCAKQQKILSLIKKKGIRLLSFSHKKVSTWEDMQFPPHLLQQMPNTVHLNEDDLLVWPVLFGFPEVKTSIYVAMFPEDVSIMRMYCEALEEQAELDMKHQYSLDKIAIYFEGKNPCTLYKVDITHTLGDIISDERFVVCCGTPVFWVASKHADPEQIRRSG